MEIPVINRIMEFEAPCIVVSQVSGIGKGYQAYNFWKWGALILALIASFTAMLNTVKIFIIRLQKPLSLAAQYHLLDEHDYDSETDTSSSCSSLSDSEEEEEESTTTSSSPLNWNWRPVDEDSHVRGSSSHYIDDDDHNGLQRRRIRSIGDLFSWSELTSRGKSVVQLWDNLDIISNSSENVYTVHDREITSSSSPAVIMSAASNVDSGCLALRGWDTRIGCRMPAILAEWRPKLGKIVAVMTGGVEKVYVSDDITRAVTVGDMRKVNSPLTTAVIPTEECFYTSM